MMWEHLIVNLGNEPSSGLKDILDSKGREGWELAAIVTEANGKIGIFKRSIASEANVR